MRVKITVMATTAIIILAFASVVSADSEVKVTVINAAPVIKYKFELPDDDPDKPGTQVVPFASCSFCDGDYCKDGEKPRALIMQYTGESCAASNHHQDPGEVSCEGDPEFASPVHIRATNRKNPDDPNAKILFDGEVDLNQNFDIDATNAGETKLKANTHVFIYATDSTLLQTIKFHTSCSQPLVKGDQFGSLKLVGFIPESECECKFYKTVYKYVVVYDANGADDVEKVHVRTFYPCGGLKDESDAKEVDPANIDTVLDDAVNANLITSSERMDILNMINEGVAKLYMEEEKMWCCEPTGDYTVSVTATDYGGKSDTKVNTFEYMKAVLLIIDFCEVDFGEVTPCEAKWVYGDDCMCTEDKPTIKVISTAPCVDIIISATPMDRIGGGGVIQADRLDAEISGVKHWLSEGGVKFDVDLPRCTCTPLNFSLHAPPGTPSGDYTGNVTIEVLS